MGVLYSHSDLAHRRLGQFMLTGSLLWSYALYEFISVPESAKTVNVFNMQVGALYPAIGMFALYLYALYGKGKKPSTGGKKKN